MAARNGFRSSIRIGANEIELMDGWDLTIAQGITEYSAFGSTFKNAMANIKSWSVNSKGTLDETATGQVTIFGQLESGGTEADIALRLYTTTGNVPYWNGNAKIENVAVNSAVEDKINVSFSFKGNGALSYTTSTGT